MYTLQNIINTIILMKRNHFIRLLFLLLLVGCTEDPLEFQGPPDFTVSHARTFFEKNATDLRGVRFGEEAMSRSTDYSNITPDWGSAEITQTGKITTVEIPLEGDACKIARTSRMTNSKALYGFTTRVTMKLVVQKHVEAETPRHFVVTMIDGLSQSLKKNEKSNCYGTSDFSGYVIVSSVTGEYLESFQSTNGRWTRVYMAPGTKEDLEDSRNVGIHMLGSDASPAAYNLGEDGTSICSNCGNILSMCTCCKLCGGKGCSECTVIVYPTCPKCRYTGPGAASGSCWCCSVCHNYPCTCYTAPDPDPIWICPKCGSRYCSGNCQTGGGSNPGTEEKNTPLLNELYHPNSSLNANQRKKLEKAIAEFMQKYAEFKEMYNNLVKKNIKLICKIDAKTLEIVDGLAGYDPKTKSLLFRSEEYIKEIYLQEELIHAIQHLEFYNDEIFASRKNVEFEAKIVQDMLMWKHIGYGADIGSMGHDDKFMSDYAAFLENYTIQGFHELCIRWKGYSGAYNPNFVPKVIQSYLKK